MAKEEERLMKPCKFIIILVAVIAVSAGAYIGISKSITAKELEEVASSGVGTFMEFDSDSITSIDFDIDGDTFDFTSEDGLTWTCTNQDIRVNDSNLIYAITAMSALETTKLIEEDAQDLSIYGLDNPVTITCSDGTDTYTLQIGNSSPTGESYYIKSPDDNDVYTIESTYGITLKLEKDDLKFRYLIDSYVSNVNKVVYSEGDSVVFNCTKNDSGSWELVEPTLTNLSVDITKVSSMIDLLIRADVIDFISENPSESELKEYGLDNPLYTIEIADDDEDNTIYFGNSPQDNVIYAMFADTGQVATFYMGELGIIGSGVDAILSDVIYTDSLQNITNLNIDYDGTVYDFGLSYDSDERTYSYTEDGKTITDEDYQTLINTLIASSLNIPLYGMDLDAVPEGDPVLTITYTRNYDPTEYKLEFIPTDDETKTYYVLMDGEFRGCIVRDRTLNADGHVLNNLKNIDEAKGN